MDTKTGWEARGRGGQPGVGGQGEGPGSLLYVKAPGWPVGPGDLDAALDLLHRAAGDYPDHPLNHLYLAYALVDAGERGRAREALLRARELCQAERFGDFAARWREEADQLLVRAR